MYLGDLAEQIECGKQYTFTIQDISIGPVEQDQIGTVITYSLAKELYGRVDIAECREATEDELGLSGLMLKIESCE